MKVYNLRVNHLIKPLGIDYDKIRITWNVKDCKSQTSFQVTVCQNHKTVYDSGKIASDKTVCQVDYPFKSRTRYTFTVTAWDENGSCSPKVSSYFETMIDRSEWSAQWIDPELTPFPGFNIRDKSTYAKPSYLERVSKVNPTPNYASQTKLPAKNTNAR